MNRWNGWGDETVSHPLPEGANDFLQALVGPGNPTPDASFADVVAAVPESRLPEHPLVTTNPADRLRHARGQSLPDWLALHSGQIGAFPDGVAYPVADTEVRQLIQYALDVGARLIPYGGGTSVVGHINPLPGDAPVLTVDLKRLNALRSFDEGGLMATFGAGITGPDLEAQLRARGFTLGHFPQSFELSTLGGWVVTRSSGQQSLRYGRIEQLFVGGKLESPAGELDIPLFPASAAGPDVREMILGSEGRMGILTEATIQISPLPQQENFHAIFFPDWERAERAVRQIAQAGLPLSMMRLSTAVETETTLALAGHKRLIAAMEKAISILGAGDEKCMLLSGFTGREAIVKATRKETLGIAKKEGGVHVGSQFGKQWRKNRFQSPYLRNSLWELGYAVDTLETALPWQNVSQMIAAIENALRSALNEIGERVHVFTHLSHVYPHGSSVYTTYIFQLASQPEETLRRWQKLKGAASNAIIANGGTISHQHGVGTDHAPYLPAQKGELGMAAIEDLCKRFDPAGLMNPGKLIEK